MLLGLLQAAVRSVLAPQTRQERCEASIFESPYRITSQMLPIASLSTASSNSNQSQYPERGPIHTLPRGAYSNAKHAQF
jgi:hypothetical protein